MRKHLAALLIAPTLIPVLVACTQTSQPSLNQKLGRYSKPSVVRIRSGCLANKFIYRGNTYDFPVEGGVGSGYFINSNGYIVTNAHVVKASENGKQKCKERIANKLAEQIKEAYKYDPKVVEKDIEKKILQTLDKEPQNFKFYNDVLLPNNTKETPSFKIITQPLPHEDEESQDIAIIKIETKNAPVLKLGDSDKVQLLDDILVIGYPRAADVNEDLKLSSIYEASVTEGKVSNTKKKLKDNGPVLQIDVKVAPGSSGSPVLNDKGEVVGTISRAGRDEGGLIPFAIPANTIQEYIRRSGTVNEQSTIDRLYREGLELYWKPDYKRAKEQFEAVKGLFPEHSEVEPLILDSEQKIAESWDKTNYNPWLIAIGGLIVGMGAVLLFVYFLKRNRSSSTEFEPEVEYSSVGAPIGVPDVEHKPEPQQERQSLHVVSNRVSNIFQTTVVGTQAYIELKNTQGDMRKLYLQKEKYQIGRDGNWSDVEIPNTGWEVLSRHHAVIKKEGQNYRIYDGDGTNPSTNRIRINDIPIDSQAGHLLKDGDQLKIGVDPSNQITITYVDPASRESVVA